MASNQSQGVITSGLVNVTSAANNTCTQTCQTGLTTFPDVNLITSSPFTVQPLLPRQRADLIAFSRFWLVYLAADWQVVGFNAAGVRDDFLCTRLSEGLWRLISCSRPYLFCLKIPNTFLLAKRKLTKTFVVTFEYKLPRGFTLHPRAIFDESRTNFDIFQRATRLHRHCMCRVLCCKTPHGRRMKETSVALGSWSSSIILTAFPVKEGPVSTTRIKAEKLKLPLLSAVVVGSRLNNQFFLPFAAQIILWQPRPRAGHV